MDGELIKYLIYFWMLAVAGVGGIKFLSDLLGTVTMQASGAPARKFKSRELLKCFLFLLFLLLVLAASYALAKYMGSLTS